GVSVDTAQLRRPAVVRSMRQRGHNQSLGGLADFKQQFVPANGSHQQPDTSGESLAQHLNQFEYCLDPESITAIAHPSINAVIGAAQTQDVKVLQSSSIGAASVPLVPAAPPVTSSDGLAGTAAGAASSTSGTVVKSTPDVRTKNKDDNLNAHGAQIGDDASLQTAIANTAEPRTMASGSETRPLAEDCGVSRSQSTRTKPSQRSGQNATRHRASSSTASTASTGSRKTSNCTSKPLFTARCLTIQDLKLDSNVDASIESTGITLDDIAAFVKEPESKDRRGEGGKKWTCTYLGCGKQFGRKENIKSHIQTHLGDRQFKCNHCKKCFVRGHDLKRHAKIHTGLKPYPCECGNSFARHDALTRHRQRGMCSGAVNVATPLRITKRGRLRTKAGGQVGKVRRNAKDERASSAEATQQPQTDGQAAIDTSHAISSDEFLSASDVPSASSAAASVASSLSNVSPPLTARLPLATPSAFTSTDENISDKHLQLQADGEHFSPSLLSFTPPTSPGSQYQSDCKHNEDVTALLSNWPVSNYEISSPQNTSMIMMTSSEHPQMLQSPAASAPIAPDDSLLLRKTPYTQEYPPFMDPSLTEGIGNGSEALAMSVSETDIKSPLESTSMSVPLSMPDLTDDIHMFLQDPTCSDSGFSFFADERYSPFAELDAPQILLDDDLMPDAIAT
ncbi:Metallothionein expression activator, partial [Ascosphaera acerosa]